MRKIEQIIEDLKDYFIQKKVLEIACGNADFSLTVSKYAKFIYGIDISLARITKRNLPSIPNNLQFQEMDATHLNFKPETFDIVASYNAMGHLTSNLKECLSEIIRVLKKGGYLVFIATWKMDKTLILKIQNQIATTHTIQNSKEIKNKAYHAWIWKKT